MKYITILLLISACGDAPDKRDVREPETMADTLNAEAFDRCHVCNQDDTCKYFIYFVDAGDDTRMLEVSHEEAHRWRVTSTRAVCASRG